jgi:maleate cis-trans isomerase
MMKPDRWKALKNKLFTYQVGFTSPPFDFDAAPSDFLRICNDNVGAHGRMLHVPGYQHELSQRVDNFHLLDEFVECMAINGADVCGQVGTNWVHCDGKKPEEIDDICKRIGDTYETPFHMAGYCVVEALRSMGIQRIALNSVYYWPDWRDGYARFLTEAGFDLVYFGNFTDMGFFKNQQECDDCIWVFDGDLAEKSMQYIVEQVPDIDAIVVNGMPNFRREDGVPQRIVSLDETLEEKIGKPIISSDTALYWRIFQTLGAAPIGNHGQLLASLQ